MLKEKKHKISVCFSCFNL